VTWGARSDEDLHRARSIVEDYKLGKDLNLTDDEIWKAKELYDSAFHSQTGEKLFLPGNAGEPFLKSVLRIILRADVVPSSGQHDNNWLHDDIL
jgi:hypothetical protein